MWWIRSLPPSLTGRLSNTFIHTVWRQCGQVSLCSHPRQPTKAHWERETAGICEWDNRHWKQTQGLCYSLEHTCSVQFPTHFHHSLAPRPLPPSLWGEYPREQGYSSLWSLWVKSAQERVARVRACDYIKFETGQNLPLAIKIVTHREHAALT